MATRYIPLIRANIIKGFVTLLEELGAPTTGLLVKANLPISALSAPESLLPFKQVTEFYQRAAYKEGYECLGAIVGQRTQVADFGVYGRLICQSLTLHDALRTGLQAVSTYTSGEHFWLETSGDQVWLHRKFIDGLDQELQCADHFTLMIMINLIRMAAGNEWRPREAHLETSKIDKLNTFESLSDAQLRFKQNSTAIVFPRSLLCLPLNTDRSTAQQQEDLELLKSSAPSTTFSGSLRQTIAALLRERQFDIRIAAEIVGMSVRSFQRQLDEMDLTYSRLVDQVRFEKSLHLLNDPGTKLADIAIELGYTDAANFTRAFKRWTGVSPRKFRQLYLKMLSEQK